MANDYYEEAFTGQSFGLIRVEQMEASLKRVQAGFAKLPDRLPLLEDRVTAVVATGGPVEYTIQLSHDPAAYADGMAVNVRFPVANQANPSLDILLSTGTRLGAKSIRDVNGAALTANHIAANVRAELYYVTEGDGYWILGAGGARGPAGPAGPPEGDFYIIPGTTALGFRDTGGNAVANLGQVAFRNRGTYNAATQYVFLDVAANAAGVLYWHHGLTATTGTALTDTTVWSPIVPGLATVATTGAYSDLTGAPTLGTASGNVPQLDANGDLPLSTIPIPAFTALTFAAAQTWDVGANPNATLTLTGNMTSLTVSNDVDGGSYLLQLVQDATGSRTWDPPAGWYWVGAEPALSTAANAIDLLALVRISNTITFAALLKGLAT